MNDGRFKGKKKSDGEWVTGSLIDNMFFRVSDEPILFIMTNEMDYDGWEAIAEKMDEYEIFPDSLIRSTGLCDRTGNTIWENNCIMHGRTRMKVVWDKERASFFLQYKDAFKLMPLTDSILSESVVVESERHMC